MAAIEGLPPELLLRVFSHLSVTTVFCICRLVCRKWKDVAVEALQGKGQTKTRVLMVSTRKLVEKPADTSWFEFLQPLEALHVPYALLLPKNITTNGLESCMHLYSLNLSNMSIKTLRMLEPGIDSLRTLNLRGTSIEDITPLSSCCNLTWLDLTATRVHDLRPLSSCTALIELFLTDTRVDRLDPLVSCSSLCLLDLSGLRNITTIAPLASCLQLCELIFCGAMVPFLDALAVCRKLKNLVIAFATALHPQKALSGLASHPTLSELTLAGSCRTNISALASCTWLRLLDLSLVPVTNEDIVILVACPHLAILRLMKTAVTDVSILAAIPTLHTLDLRYTLVHDVTVFAINSSLKRLMLMGSAVMSTATTTLVLLAMDWKDVGNGLFER